MRVNNIHQSPQADGLLVEAQVWPDGADQSIDLWYRLKGLGSAPLAEDMIGSAFASGLLLPAMFERQDLQVDAPLSDCLLENLERAQEILSTWHDFLKPVRISGGGWDGSPPEATRGVACCFTGGVDSWFSALENEERLTHLFLVRGFDIGLGNKRLWHETKSRITDVAHETDLQLLTCETNLRTIADKARCDWGQRFQGDFWGRCLHGAALASAAHLIGGMARELIVPATHSHAQLKPWGSSPTLDPHWSSPRLVITHHGCEATRLEKTRRIAESSIALETLRVCYHDTEDYNCGRCEKCLRSLMALRLCGAEDAAVTFPTGLSLAQVRRLIVPHHVRHHYDELKAEAARIGDTDLLRSLRAATGERISADQLYAQFRDALRGSAVHGILRSIVQRAGIQGHRT